MLSLSFAYSAIYTYICKPIRDITLGLCIYITDKKMGKTSKGDCRMSKYAYACVIGLLKVW